MTKKCYAAIMTAKDMSAKIKELTDEVKEKGVTKAYKAVMEIAKLNDQYYKDFQSVDPAWTPYSALAASKAASAQQAQPAQAAAPAYAYAYEEEPPVQ